MSELSKHEPFVHEAMRLAEQAVEHGNHPFGALLVSRASKTLAPEVLAQCTLYTSTEPCAMCTGAIFWAGIPRVVYACSAETLGEIAGGSFVVPSRELFSRGQPAVDVIGPILEEEAAKLHRSYW